MAQTFDRSEGEITKAHEKSYTDFESFNKKIDNLFTTKPIKFEDLDDKAFLKLINKFKLAGVDFLEVDNTKRSAIAKHENYVEYPERRYAIVQEKGGRVKFYELEYHQQPGDSQAKTINQKEFEDMAIPTYLKDNEGIKEMGIERQNKEDAERWDKSDFHFGDTKLADNETEDTEKIKAKEQMYESKKNSQI